MSLVAAPPAETIRTRRARRLFWPAILAMFAAATGQAAPDSERALGDYSIEQLMQVPVDKVYGASKYEQIVTQAPASVTIVTADEIRRYGHRTLADVLRATVGLYVTDDRDYSFLGFRGFSQPGDFNTGVLLLIDGHRVNDATYNLAYIADEALIDVDLIERVEVIRGPGSSIYGNSAFFGVINVVTRKVKDLRGVELSGEAGSFGTYRARSSFGHKFDSGVELLLSASSYGSRGQRSLFFPEFDDPQTNNGIAQDSDEERAYRFFGSLGYGDFTLSGAFSHRYKNVPTGIDGTVFDSGLLETNDDRGYLDLKYEHAFARDLTLGGRLSYDWYPYYATYPYPNPSPPPEVILNRDSSIGRWARGELQLTKRISRHTLVFGTEYQKNLRLHQSNYDEAPYTNYVDTEHRGETYAAYVQAEIALHSRLRLDAGARYDHYPVFGGTFDPRLGLIYTPWQGATLKALYGQAFRAPNDYELNFEASDNKPNPDLKPEKIRTYELVYEQYLPASLRFSASRYHNDISGLIAQVIDPDTHIGMFSNVDRVRADGIELQLDRRNVGGVIGTVSYAYQRTETADTHVELSNSPRHQAKLNLSVPLIGDDLFGSVELQYRGKSITPGRQTAGGYTVVNATLLSRELAPGLDLSASIYNLFDHVYSTPSSGNGLLETIGQDGRSFRVKLTYRF